MLACAACAGPAPSPPRQLPAPPPPPPPQTVVHAPPPPEILPLGAACSDDHPCRGEHVCMTWPGGYCTAGCAGCEGACVVVPHQDHICVAGCMADAQCRVAEGYTCDDDWHACLIPNTAVIVPRACPDPGSRDATMSPVGRLEVGHDPAAVLANSGRLVTIYARGGTVRSAYLATAGTQPALARDARGTLYAVWCNGARVELATSSDSGDTWAAPAEVGDG